MRHPITRILFLIGTVVAVAAAPIVYKALDRPGNVAKSTLPVTGTMYHIAGQEEVDLSGGIVLRAQEEAEIGELVRLDVTESDVDALTWQIIPATPDFEVIEDGRRAFFSSRDGGTYLIIIAAAKDQKAYLKHHTIVVIGEATPPGPENLATKVKRWARSVKAYNGRDAHAKAVALVFRKLAEDEGTTVDQILEATATANSAVLGDNLENWLPLLEPLGEELDKISAADGLQTREQYKDVWLSIAEGIEKGI